MDKSKKYRNLLALATVSALLLAGCGSGSTVENVVGNANSNNVIRVASCYAFFQQKNNYKGPKNMEEFKAFLNKPESAKNLEMMGVDVNDIDSLFISERDNEEIVVRWNVAGSQRGCYEPVSFEKTGKGGSRRVGFANGVFEDVEDERTYQDMLDGKAAPSGGRQDSEVPKFDKNGNQIN